MHTLRGSFLALLLQGEGGAAPAETATFSVVEALAKSTWVARSVLVILLLFSIASWSIFLYKWWTFRRSQGQTARFLDVFRRSNKFSEVQAVCRSLGDSPLVGLFQAGYAELTAQLRQNASSTDAAEGHPKMPPPRPTVKSLPAVDRALMRASVVEVSKLEHRLTLLATTASITPFIGLLGTVWGILITFGTIGEMGSTNLAVVAPGIAEALVTTAAGLFAAIPAVGFYNHLSHRVKNFASEMDDFSMEFLNIAERNFT